MGNIKEEVGVNVVSTITSLLTQNFLKIKKKSEKKEKE